MLLIKNVTSKSLKLLTQLQNQSLLTARNMQVRLKSDVEDDLPKIETNLLSNIDIRAGCSFYSPTLLSSPYYLESDSDVGGDFLDTWRDPLTIRIQLANPPEENDDMTSDSPDAIFSLGEFSVALQEASWKLVEENARQLSAFSDFLFISPRFQIFFFVTSVTADPSASLAFDYPNIKDELYEQPVNLMTPKKTPHAKDEPSDIQGDNVLDPWSPFDFSKFDQYLNNYKQDSAPEHNRIKRRARRRRGRGGRRRGRQRATTNQPDDDAKNASTTEVPIARSGDKKKKSKSSSRDSKGGYDIYEPPMKEWESGYVEMPKDLYQAHLRPGVIFRIHMSEAILKMQYRNYGEDKDESVIEADVEYLRLTRKVINDEITKFEDLQWLIGWFHNRSELIQEHMCNTRYYAVGTPPTMFTHSEEYMKRLCLFDGVYIDHIPYVVGEDSSLMAAVAPPVLHCDAATCTSVPFIDSVMFDERLARTNVRTLTRCQASCRAHCRNDPDCLKRCSDRCLRSDKK